MTSTEFSIGMSGERNSSRVLKPPGGGHTNIFSESEAHVPSPRPKYDQQNSSNLNFCMNTVDPNIKVIEQTKHQVEPSKPAEAAPPAAANAGPKPAAAAPAPVSNGNGNAAAPAPAAPAPQSDGGQARNRVPPGGFSSGGFW